MLDHIPQAGMAGGILTLGYPSVAKMSLAAPTLSLWPETPISGPGGRSHPSHLTAPLCKSL